MAPLAPPHYLELLAVEEVGAVTRELEALLAEGRTRFGWGIVVDDIGAVAARLRPRHRSGVDHGRRWLDE